eukprot:TRINITY_DN116501_c0_g1_i1.p1 TRINITY_DN116501_c0_g1~~TRINITY_DN116501_c0_g1_i1.p1  ORF type:complete len:145 (-),score=12.34 TRINITY_DN116501_c0_g1_i1:7-441(-)
MHCLKAALWQANIEVVHWLLLDGWWLQNKQDNCMSLQLGLTTAEVKLCNQNLPPKMCQWMSRSGWHDGKANARLWNVQNHSSHCSTFICVVGLAFWCLCGTHQNDVWLPPELVGSAVQFWPPLVFTPRLLFLHQLQQAAPQQMH